MNNQRNANKLDQLRNKLDEMRKQKGETTVERPLTDPITLSLLQQREYARKCKAQQDLARQHREKAESIQRAALRKHMDVEETPLPPKTTLGGVDFEVGSLARKLLEEFSVVAAKTADIVSQNPRNGYKFRIKEGDASAVEFYYEGADSEETNERVAAVTADVITAPESVVAFEHKFSSVTKAKRFIAFMHRGDFMNIVSMEASVMEKVFKGKLPVIPEHLMIVHPAESDPLLAERQRTLLPRVYDSTATADEMLEYHGVQYRVYLRNIEHVKEYLSQAEKRRKTYEVYMEMLRQWKGEEDYVTAAVQALKEEDAEAAAAAVADATAAAAAAATDATSTGGGV